MNNLKKNNFVSFTAFISSLVFVFSFFIRVPAEFSFIMFSLPFGKYTFYISIITQLVLISLVIIFFFFNYNVIRINKTMIMSLMLLFLMISVILSLYNYTGLMAVERYAIFHYLPIYLSMITSFIFGMFFFKIFEFKKLLITIWLISSFQYLINVQSGLFKLDFNLLQQNGVGLYLAWADSYAILTFLILSMSKSTLRPVIFCLSLPVLFLLNSRASLACFILSYLALVIFCKKKAELFVFLVPVLIVSVFVLYTYQFDDMYSRMLMVNLSSDNSLNDRSLLLIGGIEDILSNPILGNFGGQIEKSVDSGGIRWGAYIHNLLSYWRQFSIAGFILFVFCCLAVVRSVFLEKESNSNSEKAFIMISVYSVLMVIFFRSYTYHYIFILFACVGFSKNNDTFKLKR